MEILIIIFECRRSSGHVSNILTQRELCYTKVLQYSSGTIMLIMERSTSDVDPDPDSFRSLDPDSESGDPDPEV